MATCLGIVCVVFVVGDATARCSTTTRRNVNESFTPTLRPSRKTHVRIHRDSRMRKTFKSMDTQDLQQRTLTRVQRSIARRQNHSARRKRESRDVKPSLN